MTKKDHKTISNNISYHNAFQTNIFKEKCDTDYGNSNKNVGKSSKKNNDNIQDHKW